MQHPIITTDGYAIVVTRRLRGYSRAEVARWAGLRVERLTAIEQGSQPKPDELTKLWRALMGATPQLEGKADVD
jgi:hypothetical protein